ncbi:unnamed protein product [Nippostrongylus brasiliensis]|uniref:SP-RING-type domain-containing protein n=1 Tax=Nippostrongylus brasiliensis TaxID=27835 RepID=A0A158R2P3_NIPBR|nr:unnamed protein product [Nippostrongylus brasiliensis]
MLGVTRFVQARDGIRSSELYRQSKIGDAAAWAQLSKIRCDGAVASSSETSPSSCSPASTENLHQQPAMKCSDGVSQESSVASILNHTLKPEPSDASDFSADSNCSATHGLTGQPMSLNLAATYGGRCSDGSGASGPVSTTSGSSTPAPVRRSRSSHDGMLKCQFCPKKWADQNALADFCVYSLQLREDIVEKVAGTRLPPGVELNFRLEEDCSSIFGYTLMIDLTPVTSVRSRLHANFVVVLSDKDLSNLDMKPHIQMLRAYERLDPRTRVSAVTFAIVNVYERPPQSACIRAGRSSEYEHRGLVLTSA